MRAICSVRNTARLERALQRHAKKGLPFGQARTSVAALTVLIDCSQASRVTLLTG